MHVLRKPVCHFSPSHPGLAPSVLTAALGLLASPALAQTISWNAGNGDWNNAINWSPMNVPDLASENVVNGRPSTAWVNIPVTIGSLAITDALGSVAVLQGRSLTLTAPVTSRGKIYVNPLNATTPAILRFDALTTINGESLARPGLLELTSPLANAQLQAPVGLTNGPWHTITGRGSIIAGAPFINQGTIAPGINGVSYLTLTGPFVNDASGTLDIELGGTGTNQSDALVGPATWTLGGTLKLTLRSGYTPARGHSIRVLSSQITGRFDHVAKPALPTGVALTVVYQPGSVDAVFHCPPDLTTTAIPATAGYAQPNGTLNNDDFFFYLAAFAAGTRSVADLTATAVQGQPGYGVPNGAITNDDFFYYLVLFSNGC